MTHISFTLSMPNNSSWNGKWSGEGRNYAIVKSFKKSSPILAKLLAKSDYYYRWSDGWGANVNVREVDQKQAEGIRRKSDGFCGYNWMVDSIIEYGKIYADHEKPMKESK